MEELEGCLVQLVQLGETYFCACEKQIKTKQKEKKSNHTHKSQINATFPAQFSG